MTLSLASRLTLRLGPCAPHAVQDFTSTVCIGHLPSWPALEELFLWCMPPTAIQPEHVALLAAATRLRRLALDVSDLPRGAEAEEQGRIQVRVGRLQAALSLLLPTGARAG